MKILVTGANGFIGKNLIAELRNRNYSDILTADRDTIPSLLDKYTKECEFVFHLAGVNRPDNQEEFKTGNYGYTNDLMELLEKNNNRSPVMISSSTQAILDNPYGISKKICEDSAFLHSRKTGAKVLIYRFPNVFGKWCRPNYNSVVATFCHNTAHELPVTINDPNVVMTLVYIDDVVEELINAMNGKENRNGELCEIPVKHTVALGKIAELINSFKESRRTLSIPDMADGFEKKLYSTYLSYLPSDRFSYPLHMNEDKRGSFTEIFRTIERGQFSVNIVKPGIAKGNHWHNSKTEKFIVVSGKGLIRFRKLYTSEIIEYSVSGDKLEAVDIPTGYTHSITNVGETDLITLMWANEAFNADKPDTYFLEV